MNEFVCKKCGEPISPTTNPHIMTGWAHAFNARLSVVLDAGCIRKAEPAVSPENTEGA